MELILDGDRGIYLPQKFIEFFLKSNRIHNISLQNATELEEDLNEISNPDNEFYWESWQNILDNAVLVDGNGIIYRLFQDSDLFLVCEDEVQDEI